MKAKKISIRSQYNYDFTLEVGIPVSDEKLTLPDEAFTIRELMMRSVARTMPDIMREGYFDSDGDDIDFNDIIFSQIKDITDLHEFKDELQNIVNNYTSRQEKASQNEAKASKEEDIIEAESTLKNSSRNADEEPI